MEGKFPDARKTKIRLRDGKPSKPRSRSVVPAKALNKKNISQNLQAGGQIQGLIPC
jgi:hypothetical protein